jgi:penicillin-insensitive murein endopeptidase
MRVHQRLVFLLCGLCLLGAVAWSDEPSAALGGVPMDAKVWGAIHAPGTGPARSYGRYGAGCLDGAAKLAVRGDGYFVAHPARERVFGHPVLIAFIEAIARRAHALGLLPLPIGDVAQPRGGPAPSGHASHQTGLDVDIAYLAPDEHGDSPALVDLSKMVLTKAFTPAVVRVLKLVAGDARIDRLFVNPVIKRALCSQAGDDRAWLRKVRPWWGHHDHFHVRLPCPTDSRECVAQEALPAGDGCDELAWWFRKNTDRDRAHKDYQARVGASPSLPAPCAALIPVGP